MIVATAGHVDHGKTSLVRALTRIDTDRLPEEKRRGMSIDLGFAHADFGGTQSIGFVDVPGHERFIANMLAGVAGIDLALLVVAADDGPMPQTREHLSILALLGVPDCVVVLTKTDRVDPERRTRADAEIQALLAASIYRGAPVFGVDTIRGTGVAGLAAHLRRAAATRAVRPAQGRFRMAIDRSFPVAGAGRVVTGTVLAGTLRPGDAVTLAPGGIALRVRGLQVHDRGSDGVVAGQRCAVNLAGPGLKEATPVRGDWLVAPPLQAPTDRLDVRLEVVTGLARPLAHRSLLQLHLGAAALPARLQVLAGGAALAPGASGWARLLLGRPVAALYGDRFILRDAAAARTVAGGWVVDPFAPVRRHPTPARALQLEALGATDPVDALQRLLDLNPHGVDLHRFALARNLGEAEAAGLRALPGMVVVALDTAPRALSVTHWQAWREQLRGALTRWHVAQPASLGPREAELMAAATAAGPGRSPAVLRAALASLSAEGEVVRDGLRLRLVGHHAALPAADVERLARIEAVLAPAGLRPPIVGELAERLALAPAALLEFLEQAGRLGALVRIAPNRYFLPCTVVELAAHARELAREAAGAGFDAATYRDRTGIGRNLTVQVLEFLDREGVTRFDGQRRHALAHAEPGQPPDATNPAGR